MYQKADCHLLVMSSLPGKTSRTRCCVEKCTLYLNVDQLLCLIKKKKTTYDNKLFYVAPAGHRTSQCASLFCCLLLFFSIQLRCS